MYIVFLILLLIIQISSEFISKDIDFDYYITNIGNVIDGQYEYSIIYTTCNNKLDIISRDINEYKNKYNSNICNILYLYKIELSEHNIKFNCKKID